MKYKKYLLQYITNHRDGLPIMSFVGQPQNMGIGNVSDFKSGKELPSIEYLHEIQQMLNDRRQMLSYNSYENPCINIDLIYKDGNIEHKGYFINNIIEKGDCPISLPLPIVCPRPPSTYTKEILNDIIKHRDSQITTLNKQIFRLTEENEELKRI